MGTRGWQVVTGADTWAPLAAQGSPSKGPQALSPNGSARTRVVSTGDGAPVAAPASPPAPRPGMGSAMGQHLPGLVGHGFLAGQVLAPIPELFEGSARQQQQLKLHEAAAVAARASPGEGHSSGRSGSAHLDPTSVKKEPAHAREGYSLRTRSASLRVAWVESEGKGAGAGAGGAAAEASGEEDDLMDEVGAESPSDSEDEKPAARARRPSGAKGKAGKGPAPAAKGAKGPVAKPTKASPAKPTTAKPAAAKPAKSTALSPAAPPAKEPTAPSHTSEGSEGTGGGEGADASGRAPSPPDPEGNPDAPELTEVERRKIKRRIANRESARRVRAKRAELMDELQIKVTQLGQQNARLLSHVALVESQRNVLAQQLGMLHEKLSEKASEAVVLYNQIFQLRKHLPPELQAQAEREAAAAAPPPSPSASLPLQGSPMFVPIGPITPQAVGPEGGAPQGPDSAPSGTANFFDAPLPGLNFL